MTPAKLSESAKLALRGDPGAQGQTGARGAPGAEGPRGPAGVEGTAGVSEAGGPPAIDATVPEQPIPSSETFLALDGRSSWTIPNGPAGLLAASIEVTVATNGTGSGHACLPFIELLDNGVVVAEVTAGLGPGSFGETTPANYRRTTAAIPVDVLNSEPTQTITARSDPSYVGDCAPGAKIDGMRIIVQPLGWEPGVAVFGSAALMLPGRRWE